MMTYLIGLLGWVMTNLILSIINRAMQNTLIKYSFDFLNHNDTKRLESDINFVSKFIEAYAWRCIFNPVFLAVWTFLCVTIYLIN
jgi:hypothetical protein